MVQQALPVVQTAGLCKNFMDFWRRPRVQAVKNLDLEIRPGEIFGLLGPNGSGKTTTIKMLLGLLYPSKGRISIFGKAPTDVAVKNRIGFLPEESYLYRFLVAHETLDYYGRLFRLPARVRRERADRLLDMVGLKHEAKRPIGEYSKGMARRIGLAQALINDPEFLILDEPTAGLDPIGSRQIKDVIRDLGRKGKTILLSSHVLSDVEDVCDRVTILYGGQQRAIGEVSELLRETDVTQITMPHLSPATVNEIRETVRKLEQKDVLEVTNPRVKLEEFFLRIVEEAQAANVYTHGAGRAGAVPDFLRKATEEVTTEAVVDSLVHAAERRTQSLPVADAPEPAKPPEPARDVVAKLLRDEEATEPAQDAAEPPPEKEEEEEPSRAEPAGDRNVIDDLLKSGTSHPPAPEDAGSNDDKD